MSVGVKRGVCCFVAVFHRGCGTRFAAIFDAHFAEIHRYVASRLGLSAAEDVVADTFLTAFRNRSRYEATRSGVRTWLYGIATNQISMQRRAEMRALRAMGRQSPDLAVEGPEHRVVTSVTAQGLQPAIAKAITSLNDGDRGLRRGQGRDVPSAR
ncbi:RNA polymerase sigma factor [Nonomuraea insulae]|uniref:RNA polymerase sigma factor n=1 Tax=Nonomuraea insulae TaxID=1616787 RepID=A0ABW1CUP5_9ACTN